MPDLINRWFSRLDRVAGLDACGLRYPDGKVFSKSWEPHLAGSVLDELWPRLAALPETLLSAPAESLRWTFDGAVILGVVGAAGAILFLVLNRRAGASEATEVERLRHEFCSLRV